MVGDRIVAINGQRLLDETIHQAYKLVQEGDDVLNLEVEFDVQGKKGGVRGVWLTMG